MPMSAWLLACFAVLVVLLSFLANNDLVATLSPQGCRMSYMSPSYLLQDSFNTSWSPLAQRYSLWLYREVGWDPQTPNGLPVLFIPGNAGSSHQIRSIASSASRQFYSSPGRPSLDFISRGIRPLDFYAVEFNEDLSAFHGTTLQSQIEYTSKAVSFILSQYPRNTPLIVLGHSMGGIVGVALLPSVHISAIITMSTPYNLPPARFDSRIDDIYASIHRNLNNHTVSILSLCGGATDMMIPSESCIISSSSQRTYRRTVFTSALEGAWTGVGHREMVWCHQVRWRVGRALLELTSQTSPAQRQAVLDTWLRDGHQLPPGISEHVKSSSSSLKLSDHATYEFLPPSMQFMRKPMGSHLYLLPIPLISGKYPTPKLSVLVGKGSITSVSPQVRHTLQVSVYLCTVVQKGSDSSQCSPLDPVTLKLVPQPIFGQSFPHARLESDPSSGGFDESEGVVLYEAEVSSQHNQWVGLKAVDGDGEGWVAAGFDHEEITSVISTASLLFQSAIVDFAVKGSLRIDIRFPRLLSNALIVYRLTPRFEEPNHCAESHLVPLLTHTSHTVETHYYPLVLTDNRHILLHTHYPAPYHERRYEDGKGVFLSVYSCGISCIDKFNGLELSIDWFATLGRWVSRYMTTVFGWAAGVSSVLLFLGLGIYDRGAPMPSVGQTIQHYGKLLWRIMLPVSFLASFLPWPTGLYLGLGCSGWFAPLAPLILLIASGLVVAIWGVLKISLWISGPVGTIFATKKHEALAAGRSTAVSMCIIFAMIFLFIPWQVAYLGCWIYQFMTCVASVPKAVRRRDCPPFVCSHDEDVAGDVSRTQVAEQAQDRIRIRIRQDNHHLSCHILLFMTWLLPLVAPVLAVWVRTLITAGLTTPFDGDHFFLGVAPFLVLVDFSSWSAAPIFVRQRFEDCISTRWALISVAAASFLFGGTRPYRIFDAGKISLGLLIGIRIGRRYWGGASWTSHRTT